MAKDKIRDLVGILLFYFLIVFGVIIVDQGLGKVAGTETGSTVSVTN